MYPSGKLQVQPGQRILDLCAAPGGKTTHLAQLMDNQGTIIACDIKAEKLATIEQNCQRLGISIVKTCLADDLDAIIQSDPPFDRALVDVPCSNSGVLARRVEVRHLISPTAIQKLTKIQYELLTKACNAVKPGGLILYSTCSIEQRENELLIRKFLAEHSWLTLLQENLTLPGISPGPASPDGLGLYPDTPISPRHDGGYIALLAKS